MRQYGASARSEKSLVVCECLFCSFTEYMLCCRILEAQDGTL